MLKKLDDHDVQESSHLCLFISALNISKNNYNSNSISSLQKSKSESSLNELSETTHHHNIQLAQDINYKFKRDNRPYVHIKINNVFLYALLDTGASISIIGKELQLLWNSFKYENHQKKLEIRIANGDMMESMSMKNIPIFYDGNTKNIEFAFVPMVIYPLILGMNFFKEFNFGFCMMKEITDNKTSSDVNLCEISHIQSDMEEKIYFPPKAQQKLQKILSKFKYNDNGNLGCQKILKHSINTTNVNPIAQVQYSYNPKVMEQIHKVIDDWLMNDVIEKSMSSWRNPIVAVKKPDGSIRVCLDARKLNNVTKKDRLLTPNVFEAINSIPSDVKIFGRVDKNQAFLQTELEEKDREKTAFFIKGRGLFHFKRMPFGLTNSPATQTRLMIELFGDLSPYVLVYFDDIIIMARDINQFLNLLDIVAERLSSSNLTISRDKISLPLKRIQVLGHIIDEDGIHINYNRISCIKDWPQPTTKKELQRFLGFVNWYRRHVKNFSLISAPLTDLLKGKKYVWNKLAEFAFNNIKNILLTPPILRPPNWELPMILLCDASDIGVGAALTQIDKKGNEYVIEYYSCKLTELEKKYSPTEKECLAVIKAINHFRPYIELMELRIITDHYSLKYLMNMKVTSGRLARWILHLQPYVNCMEHRSGTLMKVPDALSRAPVMNVQDENFELMAMHVDDDYDKLITKISQNPKKYQGHIIKEKIIYAKIPYRRNNNNDDWRIIPHPQYRLDIINKAHEDTMHGGIETTLNKIQEQYFWKYMKNDIKKFLRCCFKCASVKSPNYCTRGPMKHCRVPKSCMEILSIDVKGALPAAGIQRYKYILVVMDLLSRYAWCKLLREVTTDKVIEFLETIFNEYHPPLQIIHDNASQFTSHKFKNFLNIHQIKSHNIPVYTPKNNPVERLNRSLSEALSLTLMDHPNNQKKWINYVPDIIKKLNRRRNEVTGMSPFEVFYGYKPYDDNDNTKQLLNQEHFDIMDKAYKKSIIRFNYNARQYNKKTNQKNICINDIIMIEKHNLSKASLSYNAKLDIKYVPALVIAFPYANAVTVRLPNSNTANYDVTEVKVIDVELQKIIFEIFDNFKI